MIQTLRRLILIFLVAFGFYSNAAHQVGGFLAYKCLGGTTAVVQYEITFTFYVDGTNLGPGNTPPDTLPITIFNSVGNARVFELTNLLSVTQIPDNVSNPCVVSSPMLDIREYLYKDTVTLDGTSSYSIVYQRCCKNAFIDNLVNSSSQGNTFLVEIPNFSLVGCNSTPEFNSFPPLVLCAGFDVATDIDLSAVDPDGDLLVYRYCEPLNYMTPPTNPNLVEPVPANSPPYNTVTYQNPQTAFDPIPSSPPIQINSQTGRFTGVPNALGRYLMGICVEEYRNGVLINTTRRDLEISTANCSPVITTAVQDQMQFCNGFTVEFINNSTANIDIQTYKWDFGDLSTLADTIRTSDDTTPYTYPGPGLYTITLITNPDNPACSDTNTNVFEVRDSLDPTIVFSGSSCVNNNSFDFNASGAYGNNATFQWDFGSTASVPTSTNETVNGVSFSGQGSFPVELVVLQDNCSDTVNTVTTLFENPILSFSQSDSAGCYPLPVNFTSNLMNVTDLATVEYEWDFGDGGTSILANPSHTYLANGYYNVSLTIRTTTDCIDTIMVTKDSAVHISLDSSNNAVDFTYNPEAGCAPLSVQFTNQSVFEGNADFTWNFGDGTFSSDQNPNHTYTDTGFYSVSLTMMTTDKCVETIALPPRDSIIKVSLDSSKNVVDFDFFPKTGCSPLTVQFSDSSFYEGNALYFWDFGTGIPDTVQNPVRTFIDTGKYSIGLLLVTTDKCAESLVKLLTDTLEVFPVPVAQINASDSALPVKEALIRFTNTGSESVQNSRYLIEGVEISTSDFVDYQFTDTGHFEVSYIATNTAGCEDTSTVEVFVFDEFEFIIPNVFTPNGDGINDEFAVTACGVYEYGISIYNRYGETLFESNSLNINWDGRVSGRLANSGVYFYTIRIKDFRGEYLNYNGSMTLIRN